MTDLTATLAALHALNKRFIHNYVTNDVPGHDAILHADFRNITSQGAHVKRDVYLQRWATGFHPDVVTYWDMRDEHINVVGDTALVGATNKWTVVKDGIATTGMTAYTDTYVRGADGKWLCILAQLTTVQPEHWPSDNTIVVTYLHGVLQVA